VRFVSWPEVAERFRGKSVAIVGSGPSCLDNPPGKVDGHDVVVRVNSYRPGNEQGWRTDVHYSFYGSSILKTDDHLKFDKVQLCMCKCPNSKPLQSEWHERMNKTNGIDFRYIYRARANWWPCDTFIPDDERFLKKVRLLQGHIPTTGFAAILDVLECEPASVYLTGFDFFTSKRHNIDEAWRPGRADDPIGHRPEMEKAWIKANSGRFLFDRKLRQMLAA
jgi:hypothetical protein